MDEKIKVEGYILNTEMYEDFYAVINKETGQEIFKISKKRNTIEDLQKMWPGLEVNNVIIKKEGKGTIVSMKEDAIQVLPGLWYVDNKYFDENGKEYVSPEEYLEEQEDSDQ